MTKPFQGTGAWPVSEATKRMTRADIETIERDCPSAFKATLECAASFTAGEAVWASAAAEEPDPELRGIYADLAERHRRGDQEGAFRCMARLEQIVLGMMQPVGEVRDE